MHQARHSSTRPATATPSPASGFDSLGLAAPLLEAARRAGYTTPTPIQSAAIPILLSGADLIGCAQTGTGKTAAFALPILHRLLEAEHKPRTPRIRTLVLAPTRELAAQIAESFQVFAARTQLRTTVVFGGVKKGAQVRALSAHPAILVATPGRLLDLMSDKALSLAEVEYAVLDEADRMLDMGFIHDVRRILNSLPTRRQTMLFSATMPREIESLAAQFLDRPRRVAVDPVASSCGPIEQSVHFVEKSEKTNLLIHVLDNDKQALVFTRTKHGANKVAKQLTTAGISAAAIHGNKSQGAREAALAAFKSGRVRIVVATDLASRGLDIKEMPMVVNFDLPNEPEVYVHRIGRTGRAGASGTAVSFCSREELPFLGAIEKLTGQRLPRVGTEPRGTTGDGAAGQSRPSAVAGSARGHSRGDGRAGATTRPRTAGARQHPGSARTVEATPTDRRRADQARRDRPAAFSEATAGDRHRPEQGQRRGAALGRRTRGRSVGSANRSTGAR
jgi:ATP-dependent RNA helicase RhlE